MRCLSSLVVVALLLGGCSDRVATGGDAAVTDARPATDHQAVHDGPRSADLPLAPDLGSYTYEGRVWLGELIDPRINMPGWVAMRVGFATAFYEAGFGAGTWVGECSVGEIVPPPPAITNYVDAGAVTAQGGAQTLSFSFDPNDYYKSDLEPGTHSLFGDKPLTISAAGSATIPAFSSPLPVPAPLEVFAPSLFEMKTTIATSAAYEVRWTAKNAERIELRITCNNQPAARQAVTCRSADDGRIVIQPAILGKIAAACPQGADVEIERIRERIVKSGDARIWLRATQTIRGGLDWK